MLKYIFFFSGSLLFAGGDLLDALNPGFIEVAELLINKLEMAVNLVVNHHGAK